LLIKPREEDLTPGTVKPAQVSLVEPVAYQFQLDLWLATHDFKEPRQGKGAPQPIMHSICVAPST